MMCPNCHRSFSGYPDEQEFDYCPFCGIDGPHHEDDERDNTEDEEE